ATGSLPKVIVRQLLAPVFELDQRVRLTCREDEHERLLALLATHELDVVFSDAPLAASSGVKAFNHVLGESGITFFSAPELKKKLSGKFPSCLKGAPFLAPLSNTPLGRSLSHWFEEKDAQPETVAEIQDSALVKALGHDNIGVFCLPSVIEEEVLKQYRVRVLGRTRDIRERFYAISPERRLRNPAVVAICDAARITLVEESQRA
ncbi:MAG: LysR substrate-binding domain-containing protein, partial [Myxococcota bacterium]